MARTTKELLQVLRQYQRSQGNTGTKPGSDSVIKTGFMSGGSVKPGKLSAIERTRRAAIKSQIQSIKKTLPSRPKTDRQVARTRLSMNQGNPNTPTSPRPNPPSPSSTNTTPPTKPTPLTRGGNVSAVRSAALQRLRTNRK